MSDVVGLAQVESEILRLVSKLEDVTQAVRKRGQAAAEADTAYDLAYSQAFLLAKEGALAGMEGKGCSDQAAKAHAIIIAREELTARNASQAVYESAREAARNVRAQLDALRSINTNVRSLTVAS